MDAAVFPIIAIVLAFLFLIFFLYFIPVGLWINALFAGVRIPIFSLAGMRLRKVPPGVIVGSKITAEKAGISVDVDQLESHFLAGGNVQKVVVGRELSGDPPFIIANQPTRGLDVGSIEFVHQTLVEERDKGAGVLLVSVELEEVLALSDRILVLYRCRIQGELDAATATEEDVGILMAGGTLEDLKSRQQGQEREGKS